MRQREAPPAQRPANLSAISPPPVAVSSKRSPRASASKQAGDLAQSPTIFHEPWWLGVTGGDGYREATVSSGGAIVARLPYFRSKYLFGSPVIGMPPLTHVLGPALAPQYCGNGPPYPLKQAILIGKLIEQLPPAAHVSFRLHGGVANTLAFDAHGFINHTQFTVELDPCAPEIMWRQMRDKTRNVIRRAQERLTAIELTDPAEFLDFYEDNLRKRGDTNDYDRDICAQVIAACRNRGVGRILATVTDSGEKQSAIFTVWDHRAEYYLMSTRLSTSMNGAVSMAIWAAIQHAAANGLIFDMDGLHVTNGSLPNLGLLTGFGGAIKPRYVVRRSSPSLNLAQSVRDFSSGTVKRIMSYRSRKQRDLLGAK